MRVSGRLFFIIIIHCSARSCQSMNRVDRHFVSLFGFRYNERSAIRSRPFVYSPIIIIPALSQKHNFQESIGDNSYQENGDVFQKLTTADTNSSNDQSLTDTDRVSFSDSTIQEDTGVGIDPREVAILRLENNTTDEIPTTTNKEVTTITPVTSDINTTEQVTGSLTETTKMPAGSYSAPKYDNEFLQNLSLTTSAPITLTKISLPENDDNWKMFATNTKDMIAMNTSNNLSDKKWSRLSSNLYLPGQFRPIAGLYHDGYLHRPLLNKQGFVPSRELYGSNM
ncbi:uncharacterized protein LOC134745816 [Cydia strobilella]|uniref:uncharacterized protein LOC134745816 n=1 Tax=Cydia strobilella TaxID=1100964 RepID=UPI003005EEDF